MIKLEIKNYSMALIEKLQKYQSYHQAKLISINIKYLTGEEMLLSSNQKKGKKNKLNLLNLLWEKLLKNK